MHNSFANGSSKKRRRGGVVNVLTGSGDFFSQQRCERIPVAKVETGQFLPLSLITAFLRQSTATPGGLCELGQWKKRAGKGGFGKPSYGEGEALQYPVSCSQLLETEIYYRLQI